MESQHQNPEFRINPENFQPCVYVHLHMVTLHLLVRQNVWDQ